MYHAAQKPGAGEYSIPDAFGAGGGVNFACKPIRPNYQTTLSVSRPSSIKWLCVCVCVVGVCACVSLHWIARLTI